jgi:hypothetical protein
VAKDDDFEDEELEELEDDDALEDDELDDDIDLDLDDDDELEDDEVEDEEVDEAEVEEEDEDNELEEESLDVLLARDQGLDENELVRDGQREGLGLTTAPGAGEFTCQSCFLVKRRAQLADEKRMICFDCA